MTGLLYTYLIIQVPSCIEFIKLSEMSATSPDLLALVVTPKFVPAEPLVLYVLV